MKCSKVRKCALWRYIKIRNLENDPIDVGEK